MNNPADIPGGDALVQWFGHWPSFHDAEVLELSLKRKGISTMKIHAWRTTSRVDSRGYFQKEKEAIVQFELHHVTDCELVGFNHQNVIGSFEIVSVVKGVRVSLDGIFGVRGWLEAERLVLSVEPLASPPE